MWGGRLAIKGHERGSGVHLCTLLFTCEYLMCYSLQKKNCTVRGWHNTVYAYVYVNAKIWGWKGVWRLWLSRFKNIERLPFNNIICWQFNSKLWVQSASQRRASQRLELIYDKVQQRPTHLLLAAIDLPFLLVWQSKHGLPVLIRKVQFILQRQRLLLSIPAFIFKPNVQFSWET